MIRNNTAIMLVMILSVSILGCDRESNLSAPSTEEYLSRADALVVANCLTVQAAIEEFAFMNRGVYPGTAGDCSPQGNTLQDLLPRRNLLQNPFTFCATEPVWARACLPGQTGIEAVIAYGFNVGYEITGVGKEVLVIVATMTNIQPDVDIRILSQCISLQKDFLRRFMDDNDNAYPRDIDTDRNLEGKTLLDYIWYGDKHLPNVFTSEYTEPRNGTAYEPGSIGYAPVIEGDIVTGCIITAVGESPGELIVNREGVSGNEVYAHRNCLLLEKAVLDFAWRNNMVFPDNLTIDRDLTGRTVSASAHYRDIYNPYADSSDLRWPVMGTAYEQGEVAYTPVSENGINTGYVITGVGNNPGIIIARREYDLSPADKAIYYTGSILRTAAEIFVEENDGVPAADLDTDRNPAFHTLKSLLQKIGRTQNNPVPSKMTRIVNTLAAYPGETGYEQWQAGFRITSINEAGYYIIDYLWQPE